MLFRLAKLNVDRDFVLSFMRVRGKQHYTSLSKSQMDKPEIGVSNSVYSTEQWQL